MVITCPNCSEHFDIPEGKLPQTPKFSIKCPSCRGKIVVDRTAAGPSPKAPTVDSGSKRRTVEPDIFPPGAQVVFCYVQSGAWNGAVEAYFSAKGYYMSKAVDEEEAALKLRLNDYQVIILDDRYSNQPLLQEIGNWPGYKRRGVNVMIIGDRAASLNPQEAFVRGLNTYFNINDVNRARELFEESVRGFEIHNEPWRLADESIKQK